MTITGKAKLAGIIGWPVSHSLSPVLHGHWLAEHGIDGAMVPLAARNHEFMAVIDGARRAGFAGVNVTVPHKEAAFAISHSVDAAAQAAGAVNLLLFRDGKFEGRNTDALGLAESLRETIGRLDGKPVVLLGAGGAARGAILALEMLGAGKIHMLNRDVHRAKTLAASLAPQVKAGVEPGALGDWSTVAGDAVLVVNSTSAGMGANPPLDIDLGALPKGAAVCDIVYNPLETRLLKDAAARGHKIIDGLGMLMHQAAPSFEAFFGVKPKVTPALRAALVKVLRERARPFVIGLTGSIGMGKSETARLFAAEGVPVFDADAAIHALYAGEAAAMIEAAYPGTTKSGVVDRAALAQAVAGDPGALARLEGLMHPLVAERRDEFLKASRAPIVVLDIPLLLETGLKVDAVVVASAPAEVQRQRVMARPGMTEAKFKALLARQMSDEQKRAQADYVVMTDKGLDHAREQVKMILADIRTKLRA